MRNNGRTLLAIGLDAADAEHVEAWMQDGSLPNLAKLRTEGIYGRLETPVKYLTASPWPTFYTGLFPSDHGLYHDYQWRHETMQFAEVSEDWLSLSPFYRRLGSDFRVLACDIPFAPDREAFNGVELISFSTHDSMAEPQSYPENLLETVRDEMGEWPIPYEGFGPDKVQDLLALRDAMIQCTQKSTNLYVAKLAEHWDLALLCYGTLHRGGHRLYDRTSITGPCTEEQGREFDDAFRRTYQAADEAVGRLVAAAPQADVFVFALHGMEANKARYDFIEEMLQRILSGDQSSRPKKSVLRRVGEALPTSLLRAMTQRIPKGLRDTMMTAWSSGGWDWNNTRAFPLRMDLHGYIRINLKGREPKGIVQPGQEYESLCAEIDRGIRTFRDAATGEELVEEIVRMDQVYPEGNQRDRLPDLVVVWKDTPGNGTDAVVSEEFGSIARKNPGHGPNGRSGNHRPAGWLLARGKGIEPGGTFAQKPHILDLPPSILHRVGAPLNSDLKGRVIPELA